MPFIWPSVSAPGGTIALDIKLSEGLTASTTPIALYRQTGSLTSSAVLIYSGIVTPVFLDDGELLPNYLDFNTPYYYTVIDPGGSYTTAGITPNVELTVYSNYLDKLIYRLFGAGFTALANSARNAGFKPIYQVLQAMPLTMGSDGSIFPFVVMNLDLEQQEFLQIGESVESTFTNNNQIFPILALRRYSINILSLNAQERDFYKDAAIGIYYSIIPTLRKIGSDLELSLQAAQSQASDDDKTPGFYISTLMLELTGQFNISITTDYPVISSITGIVSGYPYSNQNTAVVFGF